MVSLIRSLICSACILLLASYFQVASAQAIDSSKPWLCGGKKKFVTKTCGHCVNSEQCANAMFCCPSMKMCIPNSSQTCYYPVAACSGNVSGLDKQEWENNCKADITTWVTCPGGVSTSAPASSLPSLSLSTPPPSTLSLRTSLRPSLSLFSEDTVVETSRNVVSQRSSSSSSVAFHNLDKKAASASTSMRIVGISVAAAGGLGVASAAAYSLYQAKKSNS